MVTVCLYRGQGVVGVHGRKQERSSRSTNELASEEVILERKRNIMAR